MEEEQKEQKQVEQEEAKQADPEVEEKKSWYDSHYKKFFFISIALLLAALIYLAIFYAATGDIMRKDVTLTGGTTITVYTNETVNIKEIETALQAKFGDVVIRTLTDISTGKQLGFYVESRSEVEQLKPELEDLLGYELTDRNSTTEFTGATLSASFYRELIKALIIAFVFMALVVFIIFKVPVPSAAVILAALTDIAVTLAIVNLLGVKLSTAGIAAFLMLIGYSVDTDIMLTTRLLKRREVELAARLKGALRTGLTMTLTSIAAITLAWLVVLSPILRQVFMTLSIGLVVDLASTWLGNASLLKWYCDKKGIV